MKSDIDGEYVSVVCVCLFDELRLLGSNRGHLEVKISFRSSNFLLGAYMRAACARNRRHVGRSNLVDLEKGIQLGKMAAHNGDWRVES